MRSELVFGAITNVSNRFLLANAAARATRKFHRPNTRIQETTNEVLERFGLANPIAGMARTDNLHSFPRTGRGETHSLGKELEQSVA
jgi:hypothetical protein